MLVQHCIKLFTFFPHKINISKYCQYAPVYILTEIQFMCVLTGN